MNNVDSLILLVCFLICSAPLVWQDVKDMSVSSGLLMGVFGLWGLISCYFAPNWTLAVALSSVVLFLGTVFLLVTPGSIGEADIVYISGLALLIPFWSFLIAIGIACLFGLMAFAFLWKRSTHTSMLPFLPLLALGGFAVLGGLA